jgi:hypothetical protein
VDDRHVEPERRTGGAAAGARLQGSLDQPVRPCVVGDAGVGRPGARHRLRGAGGDPEHELQGGLTYQNPMALMQMWWLTELRTTAKRIGDAFSAQMLPRGQWISFDASDITTELDSTSAANDEQLSQVANASPAQQPGRLTAVGG